MAKKALPRPETVDKERQIIELRRAGASFIEIASALDLPSADAARVAFRRAMEHSLNDSGADEMRSLETERLDRLQRAAWTKAAAGDLVAIGVVLRIMERRARLHGLDKETADDGSDVPAIAVESTLQQAVARRQNRRSNLKAV